ncbi:MAG: hypothetical protein LBG23_04080 [Endomicrobium sp.]|jgi:hypothetical protein|nr:hypothetical protein [Endomicrobium sp.]
MKSIDLILTISVIILTISVLVGVVCFVLTLIKIRKAAVEIEVAATKINIELDLINKVSYNVALITEKVSSPVVSMISFLLYAVSSINKKKKQVQGEKNE